MSRSWERMVQRNTKKIDKRRKKSGKPPLSTKVINVDRFRGRNYIFPILLVLLMVFYVVTFAPSMLQSQEAQSNSTMFWVTLGCYVLLAVFYFFRRPYLNVTKETLETRKFTGYKTLRPSDIKKIILSPGYVVVEPAKGSNWVFSRGINLYPIARMGERLKVFAAANQVELEVREK